MGPKHSQNLNATKQEKGKLIINYSAVNRNHFEFLYVIGKGGFGKVKFFIKLFLGVESQF